MPGDANLAVSNTRGCSFPDWRRAAGFRVVPAGILHLAVKKRRSGWTTTWNAAAMTAQRTAAQSKCAVKVFIFGGADALEMGEWRNV